LIGVENFDMERKLSKDTLQHLCLVKTIFL